MLHMIDWPDADGTPRRSSSLRDPGRTGELDQGPGTRRRQNLQSNEAAELPAGARFRLENLAERRRTLDRAIASCRSFKDGAAEDRHIYGSMSLDVLKAYMAFHLADDAADESVVPLRECELRVPGTNSVGTRSAAGSLEAGGAGDLRRDGRSRSAKSMSPNISRRTRRPK